MGRGPGNCRPGNQAVVSNWGGRKWWGGRAVRRVTTPAVVEDSWDRGETTTLVRAVPLAAGEGMLDFSE